MPFKSENQRRWMHLHHPGIAGDWEKKYNKKKGLKDGGFVEDSKQANKAGDVVDAKLSPGELILNGEHIGKVEQMTGVPAEQFWAEVGVPGFEGGQNPMEARGGGVSKRDYLMKYQDGGVGMEHQQRWKQTPNMGVDWQGNPTILDYGKLHRSIEEDPEKQNITDLVKLRAVREARREKDANIEKGGYKWMQNIFPAIEDWTADYKTGKMEKSVLENKYQYGGTAKKEYLMGYQDGGVGAAKKETKDWLKKLDILGHLGEKSLLIDESLKGLVPYVREGYTDTNGEAKYNISDIVRNQERSARLAYEKRKKMVGKELEEEGLIKYAGGGVAKKKKKKKKKSTYY